MYGKYTEVDARGPVTFIPPSIYGPPELVHVDWKDTDSPGLIQKDFGKGSVSWIPWNIGSLYYRHSSEAHAGLLRDRSTACCPKAASLRPTRIPW